MGRLHCFNAEGASDGDILWKMTVRTIPRGRPGGGGQHKNKTWHSEQLGRELACFRPHVAPHRTHIPVGRYFRQAACKPDVAPLGGRGLLLEGLWTVTGQNTQQGHPDPKDDVKKGPRHLPALRTSEVGRRFSRSTGNLMVPPVSRGVPNSMRGVHPSPESQTQARSRHIRLYAHGHGP